MNIVSWKTRSTEFLDSRLFSDICIQVDDKKFKCHRFVLACASEFFEKLFLNDGAETGKVLLGDTTPQVFEIILNFIYTENDEPFQNLTYSELLDIVICANMWLIREVEELCTDLLKKKIIGVDPVGLIEFFEVFYLLNNEEFLLKIIKIFEHGSHIDIQNLLRLGFSCFEEFLRKISDIVPETQRFDMVEKWIQTNDSQDHTESLLRVIDFNKMTIQEFCSGPGKSNLLSDRDKYEIISNLAFKSQNPDNEQILFDKERLFKKSKIAYFWRHSMSMWHGAYLCVVEQCNNDIWFQSETFNTSVEELRMEFYQTRSVSCGSVFKFISHFQFRGERMFHCSTKKTIIFAKNIENITIGIAMLRNYLLAIE